MKLNRKKLNNILPQIKAHLNVAVMIDNPEYPGLVDFIFQPKSKETEFGYLNKLTCSMGGEDNLFADTFIETLGRPFVVNIAQLRKALKGGESEPELKDGMVNGINVQVDTDNLKMASMGRIIEDSWKSINDFSFSGSVNFVMPRIDYELMASTVSRFVSQDTTRFYICGYDVDFGKGEDFINFAATDRRKLAVCKFPYKHPKMGDAEGQGGDFIFKPLHLFIPESVYSQTHWLINKYASLIRIKAEDYSIDCWAKSIDGRFPNYLRVIPEREQNKEWMNLNARSTRNAFDSIKGLINNTGYSPTKNQVFFNAEDTKHIKLIVPGASVDVDGEASRPMCLRVNWDYMDSAFFDTPFTKFLLQSVDNAVLAEELRAVRGTTMIVTKIFMPLSHEDYADKWGIVNLIQTKTASEDNSEESDFEDSEDADNAIGYGDSLDGDVYK
jgi:DNA polymerase III sliding clamp (beta) subunit (PCNA family)